jgi:F-type H+-transporting ATPase subunit gamma
MASIHGIKRRIRSVKSTRQITRAMQMVAASKLRRAQDAAMAPQDYVLAAREVLMQLGHNTNVALHPFYQVRPVKRALTIVVAGDRGMAGGYNSTIIKGLGAHMRNLPAEHSAICIGKRAAGHVALASDIDEIATYNAEVPNPELGIARPVLEQMAKLYRDGDVDAVHIIYTKFHSTMRQEAVTEQLLPVIPAEGGALLEAELEPDPDALLDYATERLLQAQILQAVLEARASEEAARMLAMMNATDNAKDLIDDLTLVYNNARQAAITGELAEITAGAEAISE